MLLQRIALERFRHLDQQEFVFEAGLNLIKGPNEAGKTTLQEAIFFALLGNPRRGTLQRGPRVSDRIAWGAHKPFRIALEFEDTDGTSYRLEKDWSAQQASLTNLQTGETREDIDSVDQAISEMLGCGSFKLLRSTVCVEQDAIDNISAGSQEIGDQLRSIVTGGGVDETAVSSALDDLDNKIAQMERGWRTHAPRNPGPIKVTLDEIVRIDAQLSQIRPQVQRVELARETLIALEARIGEIEQALTPRRSLKEACDARFKLVESRDDWKAKEEKLEARVDQIESTMRQMERIDEALKAYPGFEAIDREVEQDLQSLHQRGRMLREKTEAWSAELERLKARRSAETRGAAGLPIPPLVGASVGLVWFLTGVAIGVVSSWGTGLMVGAPGLLLAMGSLMWLVIALSRPRPPDLASQVRAREADLAKGQDETQQVTRDLAERLAAFGCTTWDEFLRRLSEYRKLLAQAHDAQTRRDILLGEQTLEVWQEARRRASRHRRDAERALESPEMRKAAEVTALEYEELMNSIERLERELAEKKEEAIRCQALLDAPTHTIEHVHRLEEQKAAAERSLAHLQEWLGIYRLARDAIEEAKEYTMRSARDELEPRIGAFLGRITRGRYQKVKADDDLNLSVFSEERGDWVAVDGDVLSRGTVDQLYFATRLALIDLLYRDAKPPLLLDDPFVKFDPERRSQALALCREIAQEHQVLLFTCSEAYDPFADHVIEMPGVIGR